MNSVYDKKWSIFQTTMVLVCIAAIALTLFPVFNIIALSLSGKNAIAKGLVGIWPVDFTLEAYERVFGNKELVYSMFYSLAITIAVGVGSAFMTILAAYPLSKTELKGGRFCMTLITITMYIGAGTVPSYLLVKNLGMMNTVWALIIPSEAAWMDGCGEWGCMFKIAVPLSRPSIATITLFYAVSRWNGMTDVLYYIDDKKLQTLQYQLKLLIDSFTIVYQPGEIAEEMSISAENVKSATILFSMVPILIVYPFVQKYFTKGVNIGGVKE